MDKGAVVAFLCAFATLIRGAKTQTSGEAKKNEVGLVIGATVTPSQTLASGQTST